MWRRILRFIELLPLTFLRRAALFNLEAFEMTSSELLQDEACDTFLREINKTKKHVVSQWRVHILQHLFIYSSKNISEFRRSY